MLDTNRFGSFAASGSSRVNATDAAGSASAFFEMKTRPVEVAAQRVDVSVVARSTPTTVKSPVHSLQCARNSASVIEPTPAVFVRQTYCAPRKSVLLTFGSAIVGT